MNREEIIQLLEQALANPEDENLFQKSVSAAVTELKIGLREVAGTYGCSVNIIKCWLNGTAAPHPVLRPFVYRDFIKLLKDG